VPLGVERLRVHVPEEPSDPERHGSHETQHITVRAAVGHEAATVPFWPRMALCDIRCPE
jgi:hypothetical protein